MLFRFREPDPGPPPADPVLRKLSDWLPLAPGKADHLQDIRLRRTGPARWGFRRSTRFWIITPLVMLFGAGMVAGGIWIEKEDAPLRIMAVIGGAFIGLAPLVEVFRRRRYAEADCDLKALWVGGDVQALECDPEQLPEYTPFDRIHALQFLEKWIMAGQRGIWYGELNLVRADGSRVMLAQESRKRLGKDADKFGEIIGVPVLRWRCPKDNGKKLLAAPVIKAAAKSDAEF